MATNVNGLHLDPGDKSYAERLKTNVSYNERLKRNILEISIEKTDNDAEVIVSENSVVRVLKSIGMDIVSQVEGYQVQYNGRTNLISVWAAEDLDLERFCKTEAIRISKGIVTGQIRPASRRDVTLTVSGLDFNTPDTLIFEYIQKFGASIVNNNVTYVKYIEGPFKGKFNGERRYQVNFSNCTRQMGTYHYLDGAKVKIFYKGNHRTCGRCHRSSYKCPGKGIAKDCHTAGGPKVYLNDHMKQLWTEIGFNPSNFELPSDFVEAGDKPILDSDSNSIDVPRFQNVADSERHIGLTIANFSLEVTDEEILVFVKKYVNEDINENVLDIVRDKKKSVATINHSLSAKIVQEAMSKINFEECKTKFYGKPLYCRPLRDITPEKAPSNSNIPGLNFDNNLRVRNKKVRITQIGQKKVRF